MSEPEEAGRVGVEHGALVEHLEVAQRWVGRRGDREAKLATDENASRPTGRLRSSLPTNKAASSEFGTPVRVTSKLPPKNGGPLAMPMVPNRL